jgi:hypothetical protein
MKIFPLTIYVLLKPFIQILPSDSKKSLWDSRTTATLGVFAFAFATISLLSKVQSYGVKGRQSDSKAYGTTCRRQKQGEKYVRV